MLLFGRKVTAREARDWGLVTEVYPDDTFEKDIENRLKEIGQLPKQVSNSIINFVPHEYRQVCL